MYTRHQILEIFPLGPEFPDHRRCDAISAISGGVGLVGNVVGGLMGKSAAEKAGQIQQQAAQGASDKVGAAVGQANAPIADATQNAQTLATSGGNRVLDTAGAAKATMDEAAKNGNALLNPYGDTGAQATGTLQTGLQAGGDFNKMPTTADLQMDPGAAWQRQQMELAMQRSAAAHGGALGGGAAKDLVNYESGALSQDYQNAFNRFETATQNRFGNLMTASNAGQNAAGQQSANLTGAAQYGGNVTTGAAGTALGANEFAGQAGMSGAQQIGGNILAGANSQANLLTGGAAAQAAGIVGGSNALTGGLAGGANAVTGSLNAYQANKTAQANNQTLVNLLTNPATGRQV